MALEHLYWCSVCDSSGKIYCEKVKIWGFSSGNWFFCTKFMQLAMVDKSHNTVVHIQKRV